MSINNIVSKLRESRMDEAPLNEYRFNIPWREAATYEDSSALYEYDPKKMKHQEEIQDIAQKNFNDELDMAYYTSLDNRTEKLDIKSMHMSFTDKGECIISVRTPQTLSDEDISNIIDYLEGQMSDGWGEGFEQNIIDEETEENEEWVEDEDEDGGGYYETNDITIYYTGQFWWNGALNKAHPYEITLLDSPIDRDIKNESIEEAKDSKFLPYNMTHINPEDKTTFSKLRNSISEYPVNTYLKYAIKGNINDVSQYSYGLVKIGEDDWTPYSTILGIVDPEKKYNSSKVLSMIQKKGAKNIGVRIPEEHKIKESEEVVIGEEEISQLSKPTLDDIKNSTYAESFMRDRAQLHIDGKIYNHLNKNKWELVSIQAHSIGGIFTDTAMYEKVKAAKSAILVDDAEDKKVKESDEVLKPNTIKDSIKEAFKSDSVYYRLKKAYPNSKLFKDIDKESGDIRDLTDELEHKGIDYEIYDDKTDNGCTVFYAKDIN